MICNVRWQRICRRLTAGCFATICLCWSSLLAAQNDASPGYTLACYYFPNYHVDKRNEACHGKNWTEWELLKAARPRFAGHDQPKKPLWGYEDEADPQVMKKKINVAASFGIDVFIYDWYYYDDGPFLQRGLEEGFMKAPNNRRMKFALMWANHDWTDLFPKKIAAPYKVMYKGNITPATWEVMTGYIIEHYFKHPSYWKIDGAPYFSVYELDKLIQCFGSPQATGKALQAFREKTIRAGFKDLHLNIVKPASPKAIEGLGFNSFTSYVWIHHIPLNGFPAVSYEQARKDYFNYADKAVATFPLPYFPNVSMGWDASPRCDPDSTFKNRGYPCTPVITGNTPQAYRKALEQAKMFVNAHPQSKRIITLNSWNEWTEGSYLEPDVTHKMKYLEAVKNVFERKNR